MAIQDNNPSAAHIDYIVEATDGEFNVVLIMITFIFGVLVHFLLNWVKFNIYGRRRKNLYLPTVSYIAYTTVVLPRSSKIKTYLHISL